MLAISVGILTALMGAVAPLSVTQRERLTAAVDGAEYHGDDAFAALIENARMCTDDSRRATDTGETVVNEPSIDRLLADASSSRGELCRIAGALQQQSPLGPPYADVQEWFVRDDFGRAMMVYVVMPASGAAFTDGARIEVLARFYKRIDLRARDGRLHSYAAFVGAMPRLAPGRGMPGNAGSSGAVQFWSIAGPIGAMLLIFALLFAYVQRQKKDGRVPRTARRGRLFEDEDSSAAVDGKSDLPDDPAEALAELRRRAAGD